MPCSNCGKDQIMAKGLCNACYIRQYRFGTLDPSLKQPSIPRKIKNDRPCQNCGTIPVAAHELCARCYQRMLKFGHVNSTRQINYGKVGAHPLKQQWIWMLRSAAGKGTYICEQWKEFEQFITDVEARPSSNHVFTRIDETKGYEPANVYWREKTIIKRSDETYKEYHCRNQKEYRKNNPQNVKNTALKKSFGITLHIYNQMLERQGNVCAICGGKETVHDNRGRLRSLHVDHDHATGKIRALLCSKCNNGLGCFRDNTDVMQKAIDYLNHHKENS